MVGSSGETALFVHEMLLGHLALLTFEGRQGFKAQQKSPASDSKADALPVRFARMKPIRFGKKHEEGLSSWRS
jgi:hypothetical protein